MHSHTIDCLCSNELSEVSCVDFDGDELQACTSYHVTSKLDIEAPEIHYIDVYSFAPTPEQAGHLAVLDYMQRHGLERFARVRLHIKHAPEREGMI